jgi:hypothetical protein
MYMKITCLLAYTVCWVITCATLAAAAGAESPLETAPDFLIRESVYADSIMLADYIDGPVLLIFYDGGLVTNINTLRYAKEWNRRYEGDGLSIIAIHSPFFEPSKVKFNATEVIGRTDTKIPVGLDMEREVYDLYGISSLPAFVLVRPGGRIASIVSGEKVYGDAERAIQDELKRIKPGIILPLIAKPMKPWDDPDARLFRATPMVVLGHAPGNIANADSSLFGEFADYEDARDRTKDVVFLDGKWKVGDLFVAHSDSVGGLDNHIRIIYRGKSVWILPAFELGQKPKVYIKQDRSYLDQASWGKDVMGDQQGRPHIHLQYSIPYEIVSNPKFGAHQLEIIPGEGDVSFYYLFFEDGVQR